MLPLSAVVCTHNPCVEYLQAAIKSLQAQRQLDSNSWELVIVDNASVSPVRAQIDLSWHPMAGVILEPRLGLTYARLAGLNASRGEVLLYIDDDNILDADYLRLVLSAFASAPKLGAIGGKSIPRYQVPPPPWFREVGLNLGCRDLGDTPLYASWSVTKNIERIYPACAPIGAGMAVRRQALETYVNAFWGETIRGSLGRKGLDLSSGEDNDMIMSVLADDWDVAYLPQLRLEHLIPAERLSRNYLARYAYGTNKTWVRVLDLHGIRPWPRAAAWTLSLRKLKAYLALHAWRGDANFIRWRGACGNIDGRGLLRN